MCQLSVSCMAPTVQIRWLGEAFSCLQFVVRHPGTEPWLPLTYTRRKIRGPISPFGHGALAKILPFCPGHLGFTLTRPHFHSFSAEYPGHISQQVHSSESLFFPIVFFLLNKKAG